jgi:hypothetical protein
MSAYLYFLLHYHNFLRLIHRALHCEYATLFSFSRIINKTKLMKQIYSHFLSSRLATNLLVSMFFLGAFAASGQVYTAHLSGLNESPVNNSPGTGEATVTVVGTTMRVQVTFSSLVEQTSAGLPSGTTASHIHAPTDVPLARTAGVATTTPTFPDFPLGVRAGTYDHTFDMTLPSSYNPAFIAANGGTPTAAFAVLKAAMDNGKSYLNIHSNAFPGGEIRGFLLVSAPSAQVYTAHLSGLNESPVNNSPGMGDATVTLVGTKMRVQVTFSGLVEQTSAGLPSGTTASHIHAPTDVPLAGTAGVATTTPTFPDFPLGVRTGTYDRTLDMTLASSYNPAFLAANGGTPAAAFAVLKAAMDNGKSYLNIHSTAFPGGEIRGFLVQQTCTPPTFKNDATIVLDASCGMNDGNISILPTSGVAPYMYSINGGTTYILGANSGNTFMNLAAGKYKLRLKDANGCESDVVERTVRSYYGLPTFLNNSLIVLDATCGMNDGQISILPTCGAPPFMYSIDGGTTYVSGPDAGYTFMNLAAGTYKLRLKDTYGQESAIVERTVRSYYGVPAFLNNGLIVLDATCGMNDGAISILPTCGAAPFMYSIDGGTTYVSGPDAGYTFMNLAAGTYRLRLKNTYGQESAVVERTVKNYYNCPGSTVSKANVSNSPFVAGTEVITASPNPTRGQFRLQLKNLLSQKAEASIFNGEGKLIQKRQLNLTGNNTVDFDLTGKAPGVYYIKITGSNGTRTSKVLVQ